jgi:hypothetical protein
MLSVCADVLALVSYICSLTTINRTPVASRAAIVIIQKSAFSSTIVPSVVFFSGLTVWRGKGWTSRHRNCCLVEDSRVTSSTFSRARTLSNPTLRAEHGTRTQGACSRHEAQIPTEHRPR